ncbi:MAG: Ig-like domain-containing protein [candidate division KSB1 bacterium]|nr:Ig-like domain-containing protein [candidate division KSB1 bacterium]MDZ7274878.1 Ig-like domain-containing protein [candidate division KSB1 bacterium]MDZ7286670.1 Ig-like domain-containing protein [candidate division KSB1 bacterium]MDZ7299167.1 Ig-like domain-containing protein [candidate division KSB1 bacterium]MDZ7307023.1 Ig-like domain-containing protein [candidate division KSB1 bacterium]
MSSLHSYGCHPGRRSLAVLLFAMLWPVLAFSQNHFQYRDQTEDNYVIVVQSATINGEALAVGDEIGVFTPAGICVGATVVAGPSNQTLTAWEDDSFTPEVDGYRNGEAMSFRVWKATSEIEVPMPAAYLLGDGTFGNGAYALVVLSREFNFPPRLRLAAGYRFAEDTNFELSLDEVVTDENDPDNNLTWNLQAGPNLTVTLLPGNLARFSPPTDWSGTEQVTFVVSDPRAASDTAHVLLEVFPVNDLPQLQLPAVLTINEDDTTQVLNLDDYVSDVESADAQISWQVRDDVHLKTSYNAAQRRLRLRPVPDFFGTGHLRLTAIDADSGTTEGILNVTVAPVPDAPTPAILLAPTRGSRVDTLNVRLLWRASRDADGDAITYVAVYGTSRTLTTQAFRSPSLSDTSFTITAGSLKRNNLYYWRVETTSADTTVFSAIDSFSTATTAIEEKNELPRVFSLEQNYPNPFSVNGSGIASQTSIRLHLPQTAQIVLTIYNTIGQKIRTLVQGELAAGRHEVFWDGRDQAGRLVGSGIYWLRLESEKFRATRKMLVVP